MAEQLPDPGKVLNESVLGREMVELIGHAIDQMTTRGISEDDVLRTLRSPTKQVPQTQPGRMRVRWHKTARMAIDVVYEELPDRIRVVTAIKVERRLVERRR